MKKEFVNLLVDIKRITQGNPLIVFYLIFQKAFGAIFSYRMERVGYSFLW
jgi:hypothetical protein